MERFFETPAPTHRSNRTTRKPAPQGKASLDHRQPHDQPVCSLPPHSTGSVARFRREPRPPEFRRYQPFGFLWLHPDSQRHGTFFLGKDSLVIRHAHTHYRLASLPLRVRPRRQLDDDHGFHDDQLDSLWSTRTNLPCRSSAHRSCLHAGPCSSSALRHPPGALLRGTRTDFHDRLVFQSGHFLLHGLGGAHDLP